MIFLSLILVIVAAVTLVLGIFQDGLELIYVSIGTCLAAMAVLGIGVLLRNRERAAVAPASYADDAKVPVPPGDRAVVTARPSDVDELPAAEPAGQTAVVRKVAATPTVVSEPTSAATTDEQAADPTPAASVPAAAPLAPVSRAAEATAKKATASKATAKKATAKKATAKKATAKKATAKKATAKKATAKKATAKKATAKKATAKKATAKKATAKKATAKPKLRVPLTDVKGLGPSKQKALLSRFGSEDGIAAASVEELASVQGVSADLARAIKSRVS